MAFTQADVDRLEAALSEGVLTVEVEGERITYRSVDDLLKALGHVKGKLEAAAGNPRHSVATFSRE